jgi:hypothetical protein
VTRPRIASIATASLPQHAAGPSPLGGGPTSRLHTVPPRPKPGRKPAQDEPQTKRKAQNRDSQRAFRARNRAKAEELVQAAEGAKQAHRDEVAAMTIEMNELRTRIKTLEEQNMVLMAQRDYFRESCSNQGREGVQPFIPPQVVSSEHFNSQPSSHYAEMTLSVVPRARSEFNDAVNELCPRCTPDRCQCLDEKLAEDPQDPPFMEAVALPRRNGTTPMQDIQGHAPKGGHHSDLEVDFTTYPSASPHEELDFTIGGEDQTCGFCTRPDNCLCRDESLRSAADLLPSVPTTASTRAPAPPKGAPGSCAACLADPEQQKRCQGLAAQLNSPQPMEPRVNSSIDKLPQTSSVIPGIRSVGCSEVFRLLDGRVSMDVDGPEWRQLRPIQSSQDNRRDTLMSMEPGIYSAMEVDVSSILTTLQHSGQPLKPRPSDGRLATIVERAEELRRSGDSPMTQAQSQDALTPVSAFNMDTTP